MDYLEGLDRLLKACLQTVHILLRFLLHVHLPIELEVCHMEHGVKYSRVFGLGPSCTGTPTRDCNPDDWSRGSTGVQRYRCIPRSAANKLGEIPKKLGSPNLLF